MVSYGSGERPVGHNNVDGTYTPITRRSYRKQVADTFRCTPENLALNFKINEMRGGVRCRRDRRYEISFVLA